MMNRLDDCAAQHRAVGEFLRRHGEQHERLAYAPTLH
jgi:hypothetical protein